MPNYRGGHTINGVDKFMKILRTNIEDKLVDVQLSGAEITSILNMKFTEDIKTKFKALETLMS